MEILGIGPSELFFIVVIALILLGPKDMQKAGRTLGKWLRQVVTSDGWKLFQQTSREIQNLPTRLMREASLDELNKEIKDIQKDVSGSIGAVQKDLRSVQSIPIGNPQPPQADELKRPAVSEPENTILSSPPPPASDEDKNA
ncbi:MAG: twin-arginine translocase TatA/TatE family subunit [Chloroflexi bacterium]|nr:twin-arginine translocase TatA/TatE family subunit [Chloroflexota bacterium]